MRLIRIGAELGATRVVEFRACTATVYPDHVETRFREDGTVSLFYPPVTKPSFVAAATEMGYTDPLQYGLEHDLAHHGVAEEMGWPHSYSIWSAAHGTAANPDGSDRPMSPRVARDEHMTNRMQRYLNTGAKDDDYGCLDAAFGDRLPEFAGRLLRILRPWIV